MPCWALGRLPAKVQRVASYAGIECLGRPLASDLSAIDGHVFCISGPSALPIPSYCNELGLLRTAFQTGGRRCTEPDPVLFEMLTISDMCVNPELVRYSCEQAAAGTVVVLHLRDPWQNHLKSISETVATLPQKSVPVSSGLLYAPLRDVVNHAVNNYLPSSTLLASLAEFAVMFQGTSVKTPASCGFMTKEDLAEALRLAHTVSTLAPSDLASMGKFVAAALGLRSTGSVFLEPRFPTDIVINVPCVGNTAQVGHLLYKHLERLQQRRKTTRMIVGTPISEAPELRCAPGDPDGLRKLLEDCTRVLGICMPESPTHGTAFSPTPSPAASIRSTSTGEATPAPCSPEPLVGPESEPEEVIELSSLPRVNVGPRRTTQPFIFGHQ
eukprot:TRINITY_DN9300_c0_g1_i1.p1 TRINITY_DN9300_c0_g1~~TRINITY_DN9300_c0_g1_i1.p1  ORF type:complete len:392 (+),score=32.96 TRINITY_DN9300_c0_g1_i1:27-1178(+)